MRVFLTDCSSYLPLLLFAFLGLLMTQLTYLEAIHATNAGIWQLVLQYLCPVGVPGLLRVSKTAAPYCI